MTMPIHFDTFEYIKMLTEAGMSQDQAEAQMQALREVMAGGAVAPVEMVIFRTELLARVDRFKDELDAKLDNFKRELDTKLDKQVTSLRWLLALSLGTSILSLGVSLLTLSKLLALHP